MSSWMGFSFFFSSMPAPGTGGGRAGGRGAGIDEKKDISPVLLRKRPPGGQNSQNDPPGGQFFFFRSQPSELAQTRRSGQKKELDELV